METVWLRIGELLIKRQKAAPQDVESALAIQIKSGELLGEILKKENIIGEYDLLEALGEQYAMQVRWNLPQEINTDFTRQIPIAFLKKFKMIPVGTESEQFIAINDPNQFQALDSLRSMLSLEASSAILVPSQQIMALINFSYDLTQSSADAVMQDIDEDDPEQLFTQIREVGDLLDDTSDSPVIRLVNLMFAQAVRENASDIHIEPFQNILKIRQRVDGVLRDMLSPPLHVQAALISRVKIMARLDIAEKRLPQDGRIELKIADKEIDVRVSTLPTAFGERVVMRLLRKSAVMLSLPELGMPQDRFERFEKEIHAPNGIVLVTGPTGSGKTTTLYAALQAINSTDINIITVEDPIEYRINGIGQVQVNPKIEMTFASGLRSIVRQDPDVILVGEIRDTETAEIAIQSALTGHLVFSTLHTNDSATAITRLRDMGIESFLIASSLNAVLAQRLVRQICLHCKEQYQPPQATITQLGIADQQLLDSPLYKGRGCGKCHQTGYSGRSGIYELLPLTQEMKALILKTSDSNQIKALALQQGMVTLKQHGIDKIIKGETTIDEVYRVCQ